MYGVYRGCRVLGWGVGLLALVPGLEAGPLAMPILPRLNEAVLLLRVFPPENILNFGVRESREDIQSK